MAMSINPRRAVGSEDRDIRRSRKLRSRRVPRGNISVPPARGRCNSAVKAHRLEMHQRGTGAYLFQGWLRGRFQGQFKGFILFLVTLEPIYGILGLQLSVPKATSLQATSLIAYVYCMP